MKYLYTFESFSLRDGNKVVDQNGDPIKVYRADNFERVDFHKAAYANQPGMYFTSNQEYAETYGWFITVAYVVLTNPLIVSNVNDITDWNFDSDELKEAGYDGLLYKDPKDNEIIVYTFYKEQVNVLEQYELPE